MHAWAWAVLWICYWCEHRVVLVCSQKELRDTARLIPNWGGDSTYSICTDKSTKAPLLCPYPVLKQQRLHHRGDGNHCMSFPWSPNGDRVTLSEAFTYWNTLLKCLWFVQTCWLLLQTIRVVSWWCVYLCHCSCPHYKVDSFEVKVTRGLASCRGSCVKGITLKSFQSPSL